MQDAPNLDAQLTGLGKGDWLERLAATTDDNGHFQPLGARHLAAFIDHGGTLLVSFETIAGIRALSDRDEPMGWEFVRREGWSHLALIGDGETWFRDRHVYAYFDRLTDDGFFEDFDRVIFHGAGPCGYAACAYSVAAPGATVLAVQPQATLDPRMTEWDERFAEMRRTSFTDRYGYAPDMLDAADHGFVLYDPAEELDAMHATLFTRRNVTKLRMRHMGGALQGDLIEMEVLHPLLVAAADGALDEELFAELYRARRDYPPYLRRLLAHLDARERDRLAWLLCRNVTARMKAPRFARRMQALEDRFGED